MTSKYDGVCVRCHRPFPAGTEIVYRKGVGARHPDGVCQAQPLPEPEGDLKRVVDHLRDQERVGKLNEFTGSLLSQYQKKGSLSPKQIGAVVKRLDKPAPLPVPTVPSGRYAVTVADEVLLINVWHPKENQEVQRLYHVQSYDDRGEALRGTLELLAAKAIAKDPAKAAIEFGHRTGHCFRCGEELKVNLSKSMGVGPVCVKHVLADEARLELMAEHREHIRSHGFDPAAKLDPVPPFVPQAVAA